MKCEFSSCKNYRYTLWREWSMEYDLVASQGGYDTSGYLMVIGLNPSKADDIENDRTVSRCMDFAMRWGCSKLCMTNLFAYRSTDPKNLYKVKDPVGVENDRWLVYFAPKASIVLAGWGKRGWYLDRAQKVRQLMRDISVELQYLRLNKDGSPMHPLYISANTLPFPLV